MEHKSGSEAVNAGTLKLSETRVPEYNLRSKLVRSASGRVVAGTVWLK